jgi:hypothetical protein
MLSPSYEQIGTSQKVLVVRYRSVDVDLRWRMWGLTCRTTGATFRFMTGRTVGQPEKASATAMDSEPSFGFLFPDPESEHHDPPYGESHPSTTDSAVEPCSGEAHFAVNVEPYFVRSTASASEILTNVAIQDMLAADDLGLYELSCNPRSASTLSSVPEPSGSFDFVYPFASSESFVSDSEPLNGSPRSSREVSPEVSPDESDRHEAFFKSRTLRPVHINNTIRFISSSEIEVTFRNTYPDSPLGEDDADDEEVIVIPILRRISSSFPHPHCLSTIPEEDEDEDGHSDGTSDYEDETSSVETVRLSSISVGARSDAGLV